MNPKVAEMLRGIDELLTPLSMLLRIARKPSAKTTLMEIVDQLLDQRLVAMAMRDGAMGVAA